MRVAFLHLIGGASGDMLLSSLLDVGVPLEKLEEALDSLNSSGYRLVVNSAQRGGISGTHTRVELKDKGLRMGWEDLVGMIANSKLPRVVQEPALRVLERLREAERRAHRVAKDEADPDLHELGTLDTLIDVVGTVAGLHELGVVQLYSTPLPLGNGVLRSGHGLIPAAAPATMEVISLAKSPVLPPTGELVGETVTPTGAAIITTLAQFRSPLLRLERVGYGLGTREEQSVPNALGLWLGEEECRSPVTGEVTLLETNIDDMSPQVFGYVQEHLFALGALDVWLTPIQMKKNRPGVLLSVLTSASSEAEMVRFLLLETTTFGIRTRQVQRYESEREVVEVETSLGIVPVKVKLVEGKRVGVMPEYEACYEIAETRGIPLREVLASVTWEARSLLSIEE